MNHMVGALLDFTRSRLGGGIPVTLARMNMGKVVHDVVNEVLGANRGRRIAIDARGALNGDWDCERITQALTNLIVNALEHGSERTGVTVDVQGTDDEVTIAVHNFGVAIPEDELDGIFNAMKHQSATRSKKPTANLGLGLYIADQIVEAHKGRIDVESTNEAGTTFTIHLPRRNSATPARARSPVLDRT
jgi:signal transduction histidine kinase